MKSFKKINKSIVIKNIRNELLNSNVQEVSFYIGNNFPDILNIMCSCLECKYENWKTCGEYLREEKLTKEEVYNLLYKHSQHVTTNEMEEILFDLMDLYSGYCSPLCKLY